MRLPARFSTIAAWASSNVLPGFHLFREFCISRPLRTSFALRKDSYLVAFVYLLLFVSHAFRQRSRTQAQKPRIFWGPAPLINIKFLSQGLREIGADSTTCVFHYYSSINKKSDFDVLIPELLSAHPIFGRFSEAHRIEFAAYFFFLHALSNFDVFNYYFNSGILYETPLRHIEIPLLRIANKYCVLMGYGSDVQHPLFSQNFSFKHAYAADYPGHVRRDGETRVGVLRESHDAHFILCTTEYPDYLPFWDEVWSGHYPVDCREFSPEVYPPAARNPGDPIRILHAPNHRNLKGTDFLEAACQELKNEGENIELVIIEKMQNDKLRQMISDADIVADQFVVGWYALFAIEAMALEKPVLCYLRTDLAELYRAHSFHSECPIVNTPISLIKENIRSLARDSELRKNLGTAGRKFVQSHHSHTKVAQHLNRIYQSLPLPHDKLNEDYQALSTECFRRFFGLSPYARPE